MSVVLPKGVKILEFPPFSDSRGFLSVAEACQNIPFAIERVFWIYNVPQGQHRASHSHNETYELLVPVHGSCSITVDDGETKSEILLNSPCKGIVIPPNVWCDIYDFTPGTVCVVLASHHYSKQGYTDKYSQFIDNLISAVPYSADKCDEWNSFVETSKNGTFLLDRGYMDYHNDRFTDCSLMFYHKNKLIALLPANYNAKDRCVESHGGLTYGGLVIGTDLHSPQALDIMQTAVQYYKLNFEADRLIYKPIPYIYCTNPSQEDLYAIFRLNGTVVAKGLSTVIDLGNALPMQTLRKRGVSKARRCGVTVVPGNSGSDLEQYWNVLSATLKSAHGVNPVHTVEEMRLLMDRFPNNIRLWLAVQEGSVVAGTVLYCTGNVVHAQYIAASDKGKNIGALDVLFDDIIRNRCGGARYFDFGISTEHGGQLLNNGLVLQKEGFGGRSVVYDIYSLDL